MTRFVVCKINSLALQYDRKINQFYRKSYIIKIVSNDKDIKISILI